MPSFLHKEYLKRAMRYCAYQERCHSEVEEKLKQLGASPSIRDEVMVDLISHGFLNESRFAIAFAGGKFRIKKWGRLKIRKALAGKKVSPACIEIGLNEIDPEDYHKTLEKHLKEKLKSIRTGILPVRHKKAADYCISKGFEPPLVWELLTAMQKR